jgi:hypothetical protein
MAQVHKQLAQSKPAATTDTTVYTVPAVTKTLVYSVVIANVAAGSSRARVHLVPSVVGTDNAIYYDILIPGRDTFVGNISVMMETGYFIVVRSNDGNCTFTISGIEIT